MDLQELRQKHQQAALDLANTVNQLDLAKAELASAEARAEAYHDQHARQMTDYRALSVAVSAVAGFAQAQAAAAAQQAPPEEPKPATQEPKAPDPSNGKAEAVAKGRG